MIDLSTAGTGHEYLREGWGELGEMDTWTVGQRAVVEVPAAACGADQFLKIAIAGIYAPQEPRVQRIVARVNGVTVGQVVCRGAASYEFFVPASAGMLREPLEVALELPDACRPIDHGPGEDIRYLALRMTKITLAPADADAGPRTANAEQLEQREALMNMQSLGINCEFGFLQRSAGAEPLGLFRWTLAPLSKLVPALEQGFEGLANPDALEIFMNDATEFIVEDKLFGFRHHSFLFASKGGTLEKVKRNEYLRVGLLARSLVEEMREQRKLFVYHDAGESTLEDVRRLAGALNRYGANTLLWIVGAPHVSLVGEVRQLEPGLIQGYVSGFQLPVWEIFPVSAHRPSWLAVACRAYRLWRDLKPAPRALAEESRAMPAQPSGAAMKVALP